MVTLWQQLRQEVYHLWRDWHGHLMTAVVTGSQSPVESNMVTLWQQLWREVNHLWRVTWSHYDRSCDRKSITFGEWHGHIMTAVVAGSLSPVERLTWSLYDSSCDIKSVTCGQSDVVMLRQQLGLAVYHLWRGWHGHATTVSWCFEPCPPHRIISGLTWWQQLGPNLKSMICSESDMVILWQHWD